MNSPFQVVIIGRPNVGKSTLFNRLIGRRRALVHDLPGVTRDRIEGKTQWFVQGKDIPILLVDTGGVGGEQFTDEIFRQVQTALSSADVILFVLDSQTGVTPLDLELLRTLQKSGVTSRVPFIGLVNKVDQEMHEDRITDFYRLGIDQLLTLSAEHGRGINDLKEAICEKLPFRSKPEEAKEGENTEEDTKENAEETIKDAGDLVEINEVDAQLSPQQLQRKNRIPRIAIVGKPNVGKSTLVNTILGQERMITSPIAGTTVDSIDSLVQLSDRPYVLVDTAGIRRKSKTEKGIEVLSVVQAKKALEDADIALLILDGEAGMMDQDEKIGGIIEQVGCSVVLVVNKWDTQRKNPKFTTEMAAKRIRDKMAFLSYAPILFVSAMRGEGLDNLGDLIEEILNQRQLKLGTHEFTEWVREEITIHNPRNAKFYMSHQISKNPPTFVCHVNDPEKVHFSLKRHLVNAIRQKWGFMGSPVRLHIVEGKNRRSLPRK